MSAQVGDAVMNRATDTAEVLDNDEPVLAIRELADEEAGVSIRDRRASANEEECPQHAQTKCESGATAPMRCRHGLGVLIGFGRASSDLLRSRIGWNYGAMATTRSATAS